MLSAMIPLSIAFFSPLVIQSFTRPSPPRIHVGPKKARLDEFRAASSGIVHRRRRQRGHLEASSALAAAAVETPIGRTKRYRKDYREPANWVTRVDLDFSIGTDRTRVTSQLTVVPNANSEEPDGVCRDLILDGDAETLSLVSLSIDGRELVPGTDYEPSPSGGLVIKESSLRRPECQLRTVVDVRPGESGELSGLYRRDGMICTHCEPSGFRKITYFPDRPDNCAVFDRVRIEADKGTFPTLLSNGNLLESGDVPNEPDRHYAVFTDPHPKPCYIFGLVAAGGELGRMTDTYTTASGRDVQLRIYSEADTISRLTFAMDTLKKAMRWEEETYGLEYDLDAYMIVAARHFTIGAMENKGLNLFMTSLIATDPAYTTDQTYDLVEKTVAHEYLHNWSGNRVTVRDWFEFTLKEGLTVYRDQKFTSDVGLKLATRIEAVKILREKQFAEDASPMAHPIRPDSYDSEEHSLDALATSTTYHKGAEVCRMYKSILSSDGFRKGLQLYMKRHDGKGATCDDFRQAMADANDADLDQFALWYNTAGTPTVSYSYSYDAGESKFVLSLSQHNRKSAVPLHIPVSVGLLDKATGEEVVPTTVLNLKEEKQAFVFEGVNAAVIPSLLRDFSAPVHLVPESGEVGEETLAFLATYDTDGFNRWEAMQKLLSLYIFSIMRGGEGTEEIEAHVFAAFANTLEETAFDPSFKSLFLTLPSEAVLSRQLEVVDPLGVHLARKDAKRRIARKFSREVQDEYCKLSSTICQEGGTGEAKTDTLSRALRSLRNILFEYLCSLDETPEEQKSAAELAVDHFDRAHCFTDRFVAFRQLSSMTGAATEARNDVTERFYVYAKGDAAVMHKWFQVQALSDLPDVLDRVKALTQHPDFKATNAGRFRSLITSFTLNNRAFHHESGDGYRFAGDIIKQMDRIAPQLAVELANKLAQWRRYDATRAELMKTELQRIASMNTISKGLHAVVNEALPATAAKSSPRSRPGGAKSKTKKKKQKKPARATPTKGFS